MFSVHTDNSIASVPILMHQYGQSKVSALVSGHPTRMENLNPS